MALALGADEDRRGEGEPLAAFGVAELAGGARLLGDVADLVDVVAERLQRPVGAERDLETGDVEARRAGLPSLLAGSLHRHAGGVGAGDQVIGPQTRIARHPRLTGYVEPMSHQVGEAIRSRTDRAVVVAIIAAEAAGESAHDPGEI
ncbi:MAG: hypothetical protein WD810_05865 [Solirubrobacterales bacterium]